MRSLQPQAQQSVLGLSLPSGDLRSHSCVVCKKIFGSHFSLKNHFDEVHAGRSPSKSPQVCTECNKSFATEATLKRHVNDVHLGLKSYKCKTCSKSFSQASSLKRHVITAHVNHGDPLL